MGVDEHEEMIICEDMSNPIFVRSDFGSWIDSLQLPRVTSSTGQAELVVLSCAPADLRSCLTK